MCIFLNVIFIWLNVVFFVFFQENTAKPMEYLKEMCIFVEKLQFVIPSPGRMCKYLTQKNE